VGVRPRRERSRSPRKKPPPPSPLIQQINFAIQETIWEIRLGLDDLDRALVSLFRVQDDLRDIWTNISETNRNLRDLARRHNGGSDLTTTYVPRNYFPAEVTKELAILAHLEAARATLRETELRYDRQVALTGNAVEDLRDQLMRLETAASLIQRAQAERRGRVV
jgi:hypothetical protein